MEAFRVVNSRGNAFFLEPGAEVIAGGDANGVLRIDVGVAGHHRRRRGRRTEDGGQQLGVAGADAGPLLNLPFKVRELGEQNGSLQGVKAAIHTEERMVMALLPAVRADGLYLYG